MFTNDEITIINTALDLALASDKRLTQAKPKFAAIAQAQALEINKIKEKLSQPEMRKIK